MEGVGDESPVCRVPPTAQYWERKYRDEGGGNRTHDLEIKSLLLYQLSYALARTKRGRAAMETQDLKHSQLLPQLAFALGALAFSGGVAQGQDSSHSRGDRWQITLDAAEYVWDIQLVRLAGDSLVYRQSDSVGSASVQHITELRLVQKSTVRLGGAAETGGALQALTGSDDEVYDLLALDYPARLRAIQQILLLHPPEP